MKKQGLLVVMVALAICGCTSKYQMVTPYNEKDWAAYEKKGASVITGQAFLKTRGGEVRYGAGETVTLIPVTSYTTELLQASMKRAKITNLDSRWENHNKETVADGNGNFEFNNIPAGDYLLQCDVYWQVPGQYGMETTGATIKKQVKVSDGEKIKVIMTE